MFPVLTVPSQRILLREINPMQDYQHYYAYMTHPQVVPFLSQADTPTSASSAYAEISYWYELFRRNSSVYWAIAEASSNSLIGTCGFNVWNQSDQRAEVSYDLAPDYWNKGIMTEALHAVCEHAFMSMKVNRVQAVVAVHNAASKRLLEKLSFHEEGILRDYRILDGQKTDFFMFSLLSPLRDDLCS